MTGSAEWVGICSKVRQTPEGEGFWQEMMTTRMQITEREFLRHVNPKCILDQHETWGRYKALYRDQGSPLTYYKTEKGIYFFQHSGFEYIWKIKE